MYLLFLTTLSIRVSILVPAVTGKYPALQLIPLVRCPALALASDLSSALTALAAGLSLRTTKSADPIAP